MSLSEERRGTAGGEGSAAEEEQDERRAQAPSSDDAAGRARRYSELAARAERMMQLQRDESMSLVQFGTFVRDIEDLMAQMADVDEDDEMNLKAFGVPGERPAPVFASDLAASVGKTRRRARSLEHGFTSGRSRSQVFGGGPSGPAKTLSAASHGSYRTATGAAGEDDDDADPLLKQRGDAIHKSGYLFKSPSGKRWGGRGRWQKRWFTLSGRLLVYTASESSNAVKGMLDLATVDIETDPAKIGSAMTPHTIMITDATSGQKRSRSIKLSAHSHAEILEWYYAIVKNIALLCLGVRVQRSLPPVNPDKAKGTDKATYAESNNLPEPPMPVPSLFYPLYKREPSYYDELGVTPDAGAGEIKRAFYRLARDFHPDRNPDVNPHEFAAKSRAYDTLSDPEKRAAYDLAERVREALRRGFECIMYEAEFSPEQLTLSPRKRFPTRLYRRKVTLFADGPVNCFYFQYAPEDPKAPPQPLEPVAKRSVELRFVQSVIYGRDDRVLSRALEKREYEQETRLSIHGDRLHTGNLYFEMDSPEACKDLIDGLRIIRCEKSMLFSQKLEKLQKKGYR